MQTINNDQSLCKAIKNLEIKQTVELNDLKSHFNFTVESLKPKNLLKENIYHAVSSVESAVKSPDFKSNLMKYAAGLAGGFISKKIIVGKSGGIFKKILGSALQTIISGLTISTTNSKN